MRRGGGGGGGYQPHEKSPHGFQNCPENSSKLACINGKHGQGRTPCLSQQYLMNP